jgi:signal peptidase II
VTDFIDLHLGAYHWPAFNLADSAITVGVLLLLAEALFATGEKSKNRANEG